MNYQNIVIGSQQISAFHRYQNIAMTLGARLKAARKAAKLTQTELAEKAGLRWQSLVANVETGGQAGTTHIAKFAKVLGVSPLWLETGAGSREIAAEPDPPNYFPDEESLLLRAYRLAPLELRRNLLHQARGILEDIDTPLPLTGTHRPERQ